MLGLIVLLVAEEPQLRRLLRVTFNHNGATLVECRRVAAITELLELHRPDVVLLDARVSQGGAQDITSSIRAHTDAPLLVFSPSGDDAEAIALLDAGADDFLELPFSCAEMLARMPCGRRTGAQRRPARIRGHRWRSDQSRCARRRRRLAMHGV